MAARQIYIYDIRNLSETMQKRESSLKFMTRVIKCMPNGEGSYIYMYFFFFFFIENIYKYLLIMYRIK